MKQSLQQKQKFSLRVTNSLGNQIKLLSLSGFEISTKLNNLIDEYFDEEDKKVENQKYRMDMSTIQHFSERDYMEALSYLNILPNPQPVNTNPSK